MEKPAENATIRVCKNMEFILWNCFWRLERAWTERRDFVCMLEHISTYTHGSAGAGPHLAIGCSGPKH